MLHRLAIGVCVFVLLLGGCSNRRPEQQAIQGVATQASISTYPAGEVDSSNIVDAPDTCIVICEPSDSAAMFLSASDQALLAKFEYATAGLWQEIHNTVPVIVTDARWLRVNSNGLSRILDIKQTFSHSVSSFGVIMFAGQEEPMVKIGLFSDSDYLPIVKSYYRLRINVDSVLRAHTAFSENSDTLEVPGRSIVVFQPSEAQEDALEEPYQDAVEYYSDFNEYAGRLKKELGHKLPVFFSSARYIRLREKNSEVLDTKKTFNREIGQDAGVLFFNGANKPQLISGVYDDYIDTIQKVYGIKIRN